MRILGFQKEWAKLQQDIFTTLRFEHGSKPYAMGECFQIKIKPRSKGGGLFKGVAKLIDKEPKNINSCLKDRTEITEQEAIEDGFTSLADMNTWLYKTYGHYDRLLLEPIYKMSLVWCK